jgi:hypothetical protein
MNGWEERFPSDDKAVIRKYNLPTNPDGTPDISLILKALDEREKHIEQMDEVYRTHPISATNYAMFSGHGLLASFSHIATDGTLPIRCCLGNCDERQRAEAALREAAHFVLEPSALATLFFSNTYEHLERLAGKVSLCESALGEYEELRESLSSRGGGVVGKFRGKYLFHEDDAIERQKKCERVELFLTRIRSLVVLRTGESLASVPVEGREELIRLFGQPAAEAMAEAAITGAVLWTDDLVVAEVGRDRFGNFKRVWSELVFRTHVSDEVMTEFTLFLIQSRYFFTRIEPKIVIEACRVESWRVDAPSLKAIAEWLSQAELIHQDAIRWCLMALRLIWKHGPDSAKKVGVAKLLLHAIRKRKDGRGAVSGIQRILAKLFIGDMAALTECNAVIEAVLDAERTPAERAASKAAWESALRRLKGRICDSTNIAKGRNTRTRQVPDVDYRKSKMNRRKKKR